MYAQDSTAYNNPNAYYYAVVVGNDTFPLLWLPGVTVYGQSRMTPQQRAAYEKLRYNVTKVYPYAITASYVLQDVDAHLAALKTKKEKKAYIKSKENEMKSKFKDQLKNLTMTQGQILVKLINRQTGKDCYSLIKELRGGLNARVSQTAAFLFDNDLKTMYDPYGEDSQIEAIVQEIEARNYYQYQTRVTSAAGGKRN
jgi:protein subunit release factor A